MLIYCLFNKANSKYYIGQTINSLKHRWRGHINNANSRSEQRIARAIRKYGPDAFVVCPVAEASTREQLHELERLWIIMTRAHDPEIGYNSSLGGIGAASILPESGRKISIAKKGRPAHPNSLACLRLGPGSGRGYKFTQEQLEKLSKAHAGQGKGRKLSEETRAKISAARVGVKFSEATRQKLRERAIRQWETRRA